ncbi:Putative_reverse transcriptase/endonuclease [Hexamita inflata]|uniref:Reverse transcriptase/endonuclease n=1 Tax=Hexamita inflata TaxID=28002 RepID=A0AA86TDS8_9EUKA|nr:Putative reverse transcriptase/endonuclease [Hexamita inflata]
MNTHQLENQVSETCTQNTHTELAIDYSSKCSNKASIRYMKQQLSRTNLNYKSRVVYIDKHKLDSDGKQDYIPVQVQEALLSCYHSMLKRRLVSKIKINQNQFALWVSLPKEMSGVNYINLLQQPTYKSHFSQNRLIQISFLNLPNTLTFQQILFQITSVTNYIQPVNLYQDKHIINYLDSAYSVSFKIWVQNVTFKYFTDSIWNVSYTQLTNRELKVINLQPHHPECLAKHKLALAIEGGLVAIKFDVKRAFSSVRHELIEKMLIEQGVSNIDSRYIMNQIKARWSNNFHQLQVGINQGCNLSTILYCGFSNQIMEKTQAAKDQNGNSYKFALGFIDDMVVITTPDKIQQTTNETIALYKEMHLEVNTDKCECAHPNFFNKSGIVNFLGQDFGKTAKPLAKQITDNLKKKFDGYAKLDIPNKDKLLLFKAQIQRKQKEA